MTSPDAPEQVTAELARLDAAYEGARRAKDARDWRTVLPFWAVFAAVALVKWTQDGAVETAAELVGLASGLGILSVSLWNYTRHPLRFIPEPDPPCARPTWHADGWLPHALVTSAIRSDYGSPAHRALWDAAGRQRRATGLAPA